jgi:hypothetical protein
MDGDVSPARSRTVAEIIDDKVTGAEVKYFGRHRNGMIRDGVVRAIAPVA